MGLEPYKNKNELGGGVLKGTAPAFFGLLDALELYPTNERGGVYAPIGGFRSVSKLGESKCVVLEYNTRVTKITNDGVYVIKSTGNDLIKVIYVNLFLMT